MSIWFSWSTCWCTWSEDDGRAHWEHIEAYDYPDHEPATEWNLPEPTEGAAA